MGDLKLAAIGLSFTDEAFAGQNPGYKAQYCNGTEVWTVATIDSTHNDYRMDCNASADQTSQDGPDTDSCRD